MRYGFTVFSGRFTAIVFFALLASASANSWHDDSHYVRLGPRTGYYIVRPGSKLEQELGFGGAPTIDTADPFRHGRGADALAFRFSQAAVLAAPPAYIVQALPNEFYTRRLGSFIRGRSTAREVAALFGRPVRIEHRADGSISYYVVEAHNSFEDQSGRGRH